MAWNVSADPVDFDEAIAWFGKRVAVTKAEHERLSAREKRKAFTVANVAQADVVTQVWSAVDAAVKNGTTLEDFKAGIGPSLRKAWSGSVEDPAWRLETIFRTNLQAAYGAGRFRQAKDPEVLSDRPVWMFDAILDGRVTPICRSCDGTKRPADDPWWLSHTPPLHHNCRSGFITLTEKQAGKITLHAPVTAAADGFGAAPSDDEWLPEPASYPPPIAAVLVQKQAAAPPPPSPSRMVDGVHAKKIKVVTGASILDDVLGSVDDAPTLKFLDAHPLEQLTLRKSVGPRINGEYTWRPKTPGWATIDLTVLRGSHTWGATFTPGVVHSVSSAATTRDSAIKATLRHELGHHVHLHEGRGSKVDTLITEAYARARAADVFLTKYAKTHEDEYFAECYAAYYWRRSALKAHDPNGFAMVEAVLTERGILP